MKPHLVLTPNGWAYYPLGKRDWTGKRPYHTAIVGRTPKQAYENWLVFVKKMGEQPRAQQP